MNPASEGTVERGVPPGTPRPDCSRSSSADGCCHVEEPNINRQTALFARLPCRLFLLRLRFEESGGSLQIPPDRFRCRGVLHSDRPCELRFLPVLVIHLVDQRLGSSA